MATEINDKQKNFEYFKANLSDLIKKYNGKYLVLENQSVKSFFDSFSNALEWAVKNCKEGSYIIQQATDEKEQINFLRSAI